MVDLDEQLCSYSSWLAEQADRQAVDGAKRAPTVGVGPTPARSSHGRRRLLLAAVAAAVVALVVGLVVAAVTREADTPADVPTVPTSPTTTTPPTSPSTTSPTSPSTTAPATGAGWVGGALDDINPAEFAPLGSATAGDAIVPTAPARWRVLSSGWSGTGSEPVPEEWIESQITIIEARADGTTGPQIDVTLSRRERCGEEPGIGCATSDTPTAINGVEWRPFTDTDGVRGRVGELWIEVYVQGLDLAGPILDDPVIVGYLDGLRVGSIDVFEQLGSACWDCADQLADRTREPDAIPLGEINGAALGALVEFSPGDIVIPTAPPGGLLSPGVILERDGNRQYQFVGVSTDERDSSFLEVYIAPCKDASPTCERGSYYGLPLTFPLQPSVEIGGNMWSYDSISLRLDFGGNVATVVDGHVVAVVGTWYESDVPLLDDPGIVELIEGFRVGSLGDLPEQVALTDNNGTPVDRDSGEAALTRDGTTVVGRLLDDDLRPRHAPSVEVVAEAPAASATPDLTECGEPGPADQVVDDVDLDADGELDRVTLDESGLIVACLADGSRSTMSTWAASDLFGATQTLTRVDLGGVDGVMITLEPSSEVEFHGVQNYLLRLREGALSIVGSPLGDATGDHVRNGEDIYSGLNVDQGIPGSFGVIGCRPPTVPDADFETIMLIHDPETDRLFAEVTVFVGDGMYYLDLIAPSLFPNLPVVAQRAELDSILRGAGFSPGCRPIGPTSNR